MVYKDIDYIDEYGLIVGWPLRCLVPTIRFILSWGLLIPSFVIALVGFLCVGIFMLVIEIVKKFELIGRRKVYDGAQMPEVQGGMEQLMDRPVVPNRKLSGLRQRRSGNFEPDRAFRFDRRKTT